MIPERGRGFDTTAKAGSEKTGAPPPSTAPIRLDTTPGAHVRLGLNDISGLGADAKKILEARREGPFTSMEDLVIRAQLDEPSIVRLAKAGALSSLGISRREGVWAAGALGFSSWIQPCLPGTQMGAKAPLLPEMNEGEALISDYQSMGLSPQRHPFELLRDELTERGVVLKQIDCDFLRTLSILVIRIIPCLFAFYLGCFRRMFITDDYVPLIFIIICRSIAGYRSNFLHSVLYGLSSLFLRKVIPCMSPFSVSELYFTAYLFIISIKLYLNALRTLSVLIICIIPALGYCYTCFLWRVAIFDLISFYICAVSLNGIFNLP